MCINQRLYSLARVQAVMVTRAEVSIVIACYICMLLTWYQKRRAVMVDTLICVLLPVIVAALCPWDLFALLYAFC